MRIERYLQVGILLGFIVFTLFYKLGSLSYRIWDEAHLINNAYEMSKSGNLVVTTLAYEPDMMCTKPPLMIWAQAVCIKVGGMNEFASRLPASLCAMLTTLLIFWFVLRLTNNGWAALLAGVVLCTSAGYIGHHGVRFGEYDSMLAMFSTIMLLCFFMYFESEGKTKDHYLLLFYIALTLGVLTKGIAILMFGPLLLLYTLVRKQLIVTLTNKYFYIGLGMFLVFGVGYYFLRECMNPGYIKAVYDNELGGRYMNTNEGHVGPFRFYYDYLRYDQFGNWYWALPTALILMPFNDDDKGRRLSIFLFICVIGFWLIISSSATKIFWYDIPLYPLFAIIIALLMVQLADYVSWGLSFLSPKAAIILLIIIFSIQPVYQMLPWIGRQESQSEMDFYGTSYYLRDKIKQGGKDMQNTTFIDEGYITLTWKPYIFALSDLGIKIRTVKAWDPLNLEPGDRVIITSNATRDVLKNRYEYKMLEQRNNGGICEILSIK